MKILKIFFGFIYFRFPIEYPTGNCIIQNKDNIYEM